MRPVVLARGDGNRVAPLRTLQQFLQRSPLIHRFIREIRGERLMPEYRGNLHLSILAAEIVRGVPKVIRDEDRAGRRYGRDRLRNWPVVGELVPALGKPEEA